MVLRDQVGIFSLRLRMVAGAVMRGGHDSPKNCVPMADASMKALECV
jgi:hypothetical protein